MEIIKLSCMSEMDGSIDGWNWKVDLGLPRVFQSAGDNRGPKMTACFACGILQES